MNNKKRDRDTLENNNVYYENNNNNNNNEYITKLYNSVFNNIYIKRIILNHLNKYNILLSNITFFNIERWQQFKYKQYLLSISLDFEFNLNQLPENIKNIQFFEPLPKKNQSKNNIVIPSHIESVWILNRLDINELKNISNSIKDKLFKVTLYDRVYKELNYKLPQSLTELKIESYTPLIIKNVLPNNLKKLYIWEIKSFEDGCFPQSLENVDISGPLSLLKQFSNGTFNSLKELRYCYKISKDPIDNDIQFLNTNLKSNIDCNTFRIRLPDNLKSLSLEISNNNQYIVDIQSPSSLEYLYLSANYKSGRYIFEYLQSAPINLKTIGLSCLSLIDSNGNSILPNNIEKLILYNGENFNHDIKANHLPSSLTYLDICYYFNQKIHQLPSSLTYLKLGYKFNQVIDVNVLPSSLTYLDMGCSFNQKIHQLPSSLTYLKLGRSFNQVIDANVLPSTLKSLLINGSYSQLINPLAIPKQLRLLNICCFELDLSPLKTLSTTHLNTVIVIDDNKRFLSEFYDVSNTQIRVLRLPYSLGIPLSTLQLQDKSNLEYLHLGEKFNYPIQLSDLPSPNNIKTLVLSNHYRNIINLEHFQNLETIVVPLEYSNFFPIITSTKDQNGCYYTYNLKTIYAKPSHRNFLSSLDLIFYQFLKRYTPDCVNY